MKATRESTIKDAIVRRVRATGRFCRRLPGTMYQSGLPDIIIHLCHPPGRAMYVEAKRRGQRATRLQEAVMAEIRKSGAVAIIAYSADEVVDAIAVLEAETR